MLNPTSKRSGNSMKVNKLQFFAAIFSLIIFACNKPEEAFYKGIEGPTIEFAIPPTTADVKVAVLDTVILLNKANIMAFLNIDNQADIRKFQFEYITLQVPYFLPVSEISAYISSPTLQKVKVAGWQGNLSGKTTFQLDVNQGLNLLQYFNSSDMLNIKVDIVFAETMSQTTVCLLQTRFKFKVRP